MLRKELAEIQDFFHTLNDLRYHADVVAGKIISITVDDAMYRHIRDAVTFKTYSPIAGAPMIDDCLLDHGTTILGIEIKNADALAE